MYIQFDLSYAFVCVCVSRSKNNNDNNTIQTLSRNHDFARFFLYFFSLSFWPWALHVCRSWAELRVAGVQINGTERYDEGERNERKGKEKKKKKNFMSENILSFVISTRHSALCVICILESRLGRPGVFQWVSPPSLCSFSENAAEQTYRTSALSLLLCIRRYSITMYNFFPPGVHPMPSTRLNNFVTTKTKQKKKRNFLSLSFFFSFFFFLFHLYISTFHRHDGARVLSQLRATLKFLNG